MVVEEPRLLHRRSELGYTSRSSHSLRSEPEAVSADEQRRLTALAAQRARADRRLAWLECKARLMAETELLRETFGTEISDELRQLRRVLDRLQTKLG